MGGEEGNRGAVGGGGEWRGVQAGVQASGHLGRQPSKNFQKRFAKRFESKRKYCNFIVSFALEFLIAAGWMDMTVLEFRQGTYKGQYQEKALDT